MRTNRVFFKHASAALFGRPGITILLLLSIASALFCVDVISGYGEFYYQESIDWIMYQSFSMTDLCENEMAYEMDMRSYIEDKYGCEVDAVLYCSRKKEEDNPFGEGLVIGYDGELEFSCWWAPTAGRDHFTPEELSEGKQVAYVSDSVRADLHVTDQVKIGYLDYKIIGSTFFVDYNITPLLPKSKVDELFPKATVNGMNFRHYYVMPFRAYIREGFLPDFILVKMRGMETKDVRKIADTLYEDFEGISGAYPPMDTAGLRQDSDLKYGKYGGLLCIGALLGAIGVFGLWVRSQSKKSWVFMACGLSRKKIILYGCLETLILVAGGKLLAYTANVVFRNSLEQLKVLMIPFAPIPVSALVLTCIISMSIVAINITRVTRTQKNYE